MNDTSTIFHSYIIIAVYEKCFLVLLVSGILCTLVKWLIFLIFKVFTLVFFNNLISRCAFFSLDSTKNLVKKCLCHDVCESICCLNSRISLIWINTKSNIRAECPRSCCPCKEICILSNNLESYNCCTLFKSLVALGNLM